jgi:hypothetical protein
LFQSSDSQIKDGINSTNPSEVSVYGQTLRICPNLIAEGIISFVRWDKIDDKNKNKIFRIVRNQNYEKTNCSNQYDT